MRLNTFWDKEEHSDKHSTSALLAKLLLPIFPKNEVIVDFGCGLGFYVEKFQQAGFSSYGIEGSSDIKDYALTKDIVVADLSKPFDIILRHSSLSLEVGEHIANEFEDVFMDNITKNCAGKLVLSWAIPNQGGYRHENEHDNEYVIKRIENRGFKLNQTETESIRDKIADDNCRWFKKSLMVFDRV